MMPGRRSRRHRRAGRRCREDRGRRRALPRHAGGRRDGRRCGFGCHFGRNRRGEFDRADHRRCHGRPAVVDGDGMGRAFPEVQMTTYMIYGAAAAPAAIADDKGNVVVFKEMVDMFWLERCASRRFRRTGAGAGLAVAPMRGDFARRTAVPGTVTQALEIGRTILDARAKRQNVVERIVDSTGATLFFTGKITDIKRELTGGFSRGHAILSGLGNGPDARRASPSRTKTSFSGSMTSRW